MWVLSLQKLPGKNGGYHKGGNKGLRHISQLRMRPRSQEAATVISSYRWASQQRASNSAEPTDPFKHLGMELRVGRGGQRLLTGLLGLLGGRGDQAGSDSQASSWAG